MTSSTRSGIRDTRRRSNTGIADKRIDGSFHDVKLVYLADSREGNITRICLAVNKAKRCLPAKDLEAEDVEYYMTMCRRL